MRKTKQFMNNIIQLVKLGGMHSAVFQQVDSKSLTSFVSRTCCERIEWSIYLEPETHCGDDLSSSAICKRKKRKSMVKFKTLKESSSMLWC